MHSWACNLQPRDVVNPLLNKLTLILLFDGGLTGDGTGSLFK